MTGAYVPACLRHLALALLLCAACFTPGPAAAQAQDRWTVTEARDATIQQTAAASWTALKPGDVVAEGASARTGVEGRLVLVRTSHKDSITASSLSQFTVPALATEATAPTILQTLGTLLFKVEHTPGRRFEVKGPYLTAVVKGTVFTVSITTAENVVHLASGSVEVTDTNTGQVALLRPGQTARVPVVRGRPMKVTGVMGPDSAEPTTMEARGGSSPPKITRTLGDTQLDIAALTNNLVRPASLSSAASNTSNGQSSASGTAGGVISGTTGALDTIVATTTGTASNVVSGASDTVGGTVGNVASAAGSAVGGVASSVGGAVGNVASGAGGTVGALANGVGGAVGSVASGVGGAVGGAASDVGGTLGGVVGTTGNAVASTAGTLGSTLGGVVNTVGGTVGSTVGTLGSAAGNPATPAGTTASPTGNLLTSTLSGVTGTVSGLLGGSKRGLKLP